MTRRTLSSAIRAARLKTAGAFLWRHNGVVALILFAAVGLAVLDDYGVSADGRAQWDIGWQTLDYIMGDADNLPVHRLDRYYGMALEIPLIVIELAFGLEFKRDIYLTRHALTHAFHLAGGMFAWALALRMFGSRAVALFAMLIFLLHPRIYAHSFFNTKDAPFAAMFMVSLYMIHRAFGKNTVAAFALCGAAVGLLANMRVMGIALFPAVIAMQTYDAAAALWAGGGAKRAVAAIAAFAIAAPLALYATWPIWSVEPLAPVDAFIALSNHPTHKFELFGGEYIHNTDLPPHFLPVWMAITTPPMIMALAAVGAIAALWAGARRPLDALGNADTRFRLLLVAAVILTLAAVATFRPHMIHDWRHFYFLHAPISLLAASGVWTLARAAAALTKRARGLLGERLASPALARVAVYAAVFLGMGAIVGEMVPIHPHQMVYFNSFVDRETPEYLRTQYEMDYWSPSQWEGLRWVLANHPDSKPLTRADGKSQLLLSERQKAAILHTGNAPLVDFLAFHHLYYNPEAFAPYAYTRRVYNNSIMSVAAVNLDFVDEETAAPYYRLYQDAKSGALGEPIARADFDVWLDGREALIYARDDCERHEDAAFEFYVNVAPVFTDQTPPFGFEPGPDWFQARFDFPQRGVRFGGKCLMMFPLPDVPIRAVQTGARGVPLWVETTFPPEGEALERLRSEYARLSALEPAVRSGYDVHADGGALAILKAPCAQEDTLGGFFVSVFPTDADNVSDDRKAKGLAHNSLNFAFAPRGSVFDGKCMAWRVLPDYGISAVELGQWGEGVDSWNARLIPLPDGTLADERLAEYGRATGGWMGEPIVRSVFDVYLDDNALLYAKAPCSQDDAAGRFLVSVFPTDADDVSDDRKAMGLAHDSLNFAFAERGFILDGKCSARVELPDYAINRLELGQWIPGGETRWFEAAAMPAR